MQMIEHKLIMYSQLAVLYKLMKKWEMKAKVPTKTFQKIKVLISKRNLKMRKYRQSLVKTKNKRSLGVKLSNNSLLLRKCFQMRTWNCLRVFLNGSYPHWQASLWTGYNIWRLIHIRETSSARRSRIWLASTRRSSKTWSQRSDMAID